MINSTFCCPVIAKTALVLLRIAIGWHLLFEGLYKLDTYSTSNPWSAEWYLQNSEGPAAGFFRRLAPQGLPLERFDMPTVSANWLRVIDRFDRFYEFNPDQYESARSEQRFFEKRLQANVFNDPQIQSIIKQYISDKEVVPESRTTSEWRRLSTHRQRLRREVKNYTEKLKIQLYELLEPEQHALGPLPRGTVAIIDWCVVGGLIATGFCLMVGLCSRCVALLAAVLLLSFYAAMPPLPGLTAATDGIAHYMYVNTTLIESLALLVLATTHSGRWAGLDLIFHKVYIGFFGDTEQKGTA